MRRLAMSTRLRKAVEQKQWMLHYQPLVELSTSSMYGVEARSGGMSPTAGSFPPESSSLWPKRWD